MASLLASLMTKYETFTAALFPGAARPPVFEEPAPETYSGSLLYPPYVTISVQESGSALTLEFKHLYAFRVTVTAYAYTQEDADTTVTVTRYNGGSASAAGGFDLGALAALTDGTLLALRPAGPPRPGFSGYGKDGKRVHATVMTYTADVAK